MVINENHDILFQSGDINQDHCLRSTLKPFQSAASINLGTHTKYNFSEAINLKKIDFLYDDIINRQNNDLKFLKKSTINDIFQNLVDDYVIEKIVDTSTPYIILIKTLEIIPANTQNNYQDVLKNLQNQINEQFKNDIAVSFINNLRTKYEPKVNFNLLEQIINNIQ